MGLGYWVATLSEQFGLMIEYMELRRQVKMVIVAQLSREWSNVSVCVPRTVVKHATIDAQDGLMQPSLQERDVETSVARYQ